jgi:hypothetical protein
VVLGGAALAVVVAASGIALAMTRDTGLPPTAGQFPTPGGVTPGGLATTTAPGAPSTPTGGTGAVPGAGAAVRSYQGTLSWVWGTSGSKSSMVNVYCTAGGCVTALSNRVPTLVSIPLGDGAPGTYPFALPRRGDPCSAKGIPIDAIRGAVVLSERALSFKSTSPGWDLRCGNGRFTYYAKRTMSYAGTLQP